MSSSAGPVLEVDGLTVRLQSHQGTAMAVMDVSLCIEPGETLALVGESGSGKSLTALSVIGLHPQPAATVVGGDVRINGRSVLELTPEEWSHVRGREIGMILQDPLTALNPVFPIGKQVAEGIRRHEGLRGDALQDRVVSLLEAVEIPRAAARLNDFPHQFSGGMRQRVVGAIAIACNPSVLIADEPTTGLDVTVERAYLQLLRELQRDTGVGILFITHDFGVVRDFADRVAVMYSGKIIETGPTHEVLRNPAHPYTEGLVGSVIDARLPAPARLPSIPGAPPALFESKPACHFAPRCSYVMDKCWVDVPPDFSKREGQSAKCWKLEP